MSDEPEIKRVDCPTCGQSVLWSQENQHRPFCSERCKLIDFGDWANERHAIAGEPVFPWQDGEDEPIQ